MRKWISYSIIVLFLILPLLVIGQTRKGLEKKRKNILKEIKQTDKLLLQTAKNKEQTYERYITTKKQIKNRKELILTIQAELLYYDKSLVRTSEVIEAMEKDIERVKKDYAQLLRYAYKRKLMKSDLLFLFSAQSFNQAFVRWQYLKQYDKYRKKQAIRIIQTHASLEKKIALQAERTREKRRLLDSEKNQLTVLENELQIKNRLFLQLKKEESKLRVKMDKKKGEHEQLNVAIEKIIQEGVIGQRARNRSSSTYKNKPSTNSSISAEESRMISGDFRSNKGSLPWPVKGIISSAFGKQAHPTIPDITIDNSGVDILTTNNALVKPVAAGEVAAVRFVPGNDYLIIIKHGDYYTLYSKLEEHFVRKGERVTPNQDIGRVRTDVKTGNSELHFEVWKKQTRLNPKYWIK